MQKIVVFGQHLQPSMETSDWPSDIRPKFSGLGSLRKTTEFFNTQICVQISSLTAVYAELASRSKDGAVIPLPAESPFPNRYNIRVAPFCPYYNIFPDSIIEFRAGIATQDAFLLEEEVLKKEAQGEHFILAKDLKGALDNASD